jgi:hypothetical protein
MKITTTLKNTKADKAKKQSNLLAAHKRIVRHDNHSYLIYVQKLGPLFLANAEPMTGTDRTLINLFDPKNKKAKEILTLCQEHIFS